MSGLEFVAVLGIAASAIEVVRACSKIVARIRKCSHSVVFEDLKIQLQLFSKEVDHLSNPVNHLDLDPSTEALLGEVLKGCHRQLEKLDTALQSITSDTKSSKLRRAIYGIRSGARETEVREILSILSAYQASILVHLSRRNLQNTAQIPRVISLLEEKILSQKSPPSQPPTDQTVDISSSEVTTVAVQQTSRQRNTQRPRRASKCVRGICECQCHLSMTKKPWSCVAVSLVRGTICDCDNQEYSVVMQLFRKLCLLRFSMNCYNGLSINFSLQYRGVIKDTSPGFLVLYKCERGSMSLSQACKELRTLRMSGEINFKEVDPFGRGWVEKLLYVPWKPQYRDIQFGLLDEIFSEGTIVPTDKILLRCMKWMGLGPHLQLLERLLVLGIDPSEAGFELFPKWPAPHGLPSPMDDPFFIKAIAKLIHYDLEFGLTSPLQRAVLMNDFIEVKLLLDRSNPSIFTETNFKGQTALHLSILDPRIVLFLINNGFSDFIDYKDRNGATPLMYTDTS